MNYTIISYKSRSVASRVFGYLVNNGYSCSMVSTPRAVGIGCGLSIRISLVDIQRAKLTQVSSYAGVYEISNVNGRLTVKNVSF